MAKKVKFKGTSFNFGANVRSKGGKGKGKKAKGSGRSGKGGGS